MKKNFLGDLIAEFLDREKEISEKFNELVKKAEHISDPFKNIFFQLEEIIPLQIEGLVIMDRLNLLAGVNNKLLGIQNDKMDDMISLVTSITSNSWKLTKQNLHNLKKQIQIIEKEIKSSPNSKEK